MDSFGSTFYHLGSEVRTLFDAKKIKSRNLSKIYSSFILLEKRKKRIQGRYRNRSGESFRWVLI